MMKQQQNISMSGKNNSINKTGHLSNLEADQNRNTEGDIKKADLKSQHIKDIVKQQTYFI